MHIPLLGRRGLTSPAKVWSANPDHPIGPISTIGLDLTFDQTSWSSPVLLGTFGTLLYPKKISPTIMAGVACPWGKKSLLYFSMPIVYTLLDLNTTMFKHRKSSNN